MDSNPQQERAFAVEVVRQLRAAGYIAYWAGGCVRDHLLNREPVDFDVATSARPEQITAVFKNRKTLAIGAAFGVITVLGPRGAGQIEVATFRQDVGYTDGRHPDAVTFSSAEEDAKRRDFTINGMFFDPLEEQLIDYVGGQEDLAHKYIRAIGNPHERFTEDKLRMLRAVRFAATLGFSVDDATLDAIAEMSREITVVSAERIAAEMRRMLVHPSRAQAAQLLAASGLLKQILPQPLGAELETALSDDPKLLEMLFALQNATFSLAMSVLLFDFPPQQLAETVGAAWKLSRAEIDRLAWLSQHRQALAGARSRRWSEIQPLLVHDGATELVELHRAQMHCCKNIDSYDVAFCLEKLAEAANQLNPPPLIDGANLIALGIRPGPVFAEFLQRARNAQLDGELKSHADAVALIQSLRTEKNDRKSAP